MQKSKRVAILATVLLLLPLELLILVGMLPYLPLVGKAFVGMLVTFCVCGAVYAVALTYQRITAPRLIVADGVVVWVTRKGEYKHLSAEHEAAKLPLLQLPAPAVRVTEVDQVAYSPGDLEILAMVSQGKSQEVVAKACGTNQTYVSRLVRRYKEQHHMD